MLIWKPNNTLDVLNVALASKEAKHAQLLDNAEQTNKISAVIQENALLFLIPSRTRKGSAIAKFMKKRPSTFWINRTCQSESGARIVCMVGIQVPVNSASPTSIRLKLNLLDRVVGRVQM